MSDTTDDMEWGLGRLEASMDETGSVHDQTPVKQAMNLVDQLEVISDLVRYDKPTYQVLRKLHEVKVGIRALVPVLRKAQEESE
jgi:hypothetical protein